MSPAENNTNRFDIIIERRLKGDPVVEIAKDLGISRQYIYSLFENLPKSDEKLKCKKDFSLAEEKEIVHEYMAAIPSASYIRAHGLETYMKSAVTSLAERHNVSENDIMAVVCKMTNHHPTVSRSPYYTNLVKWRAEHAVSLSELAKIAGVSVPHMRDILRGWKHLPLQAAKNIKRCSGLMISEIYSDLLRLDKEAAAE